MGVNLEVVDLQNFTLPKDKVLGILIQYPDTEGRIEGWEGVIEEAHLANVMVVASPQETCLITNRIHVYLLGVVYRAWLPWQQTPWLWCS